jgi:integral membrane protein (TIGR01906 family)
VTRARVRFGAILLFAALFLLTPPILLTAFDLAVLDDGVHMRLYAQNGSADAAGLSPEALALTGRAIVQYLKGARADLRIEAEIDGETAEVFNARERTHMEDVKRLFDVSRAVRLYCLVGAAVCLAAAIALAGRRLPVFKAGAFAALLWLLALGGFALYAAADFTRAFTLFHEALFSNDLWLLDPRTDRMIRMMPEAFFGALAARAAVFMGAAFALYAACLCLTGRAVRRGKR